MQDKNNRLLRNLVSEPGDKSSQPDKVSFITAMQQMGMTSVFDIIGQSKPLFVERLGEICDADGALAYDNAMCYAVQIGVLYREHRVSSGKPQELTRRTGVRALVDVGPSYPNLFKENWDEFCKVGAIAALDSPVAYLSSLYQFATRTLETSGQGDRPKILLGKRRPDIASLVIDQQSTFTPRPMLELVNGILQEDIRRYRQGKPDENKPVYELLAERRYPFIFPYHFAHHQCRLGLAEKKLGLGVLNYLISREVPATQGDRNVYGAVQNASLEAQRMLSGLSPQQQQLLIEPSLFTTFYLSKAELAAGWKGPGTSHLRPHKALGVGFLLLPGQDSIEAVDPRADFLINDSSLTNIATIYFSKADSPEKLLQQVSFNSGTPANSNVWRLNHLHGATNLTLCPRISWSRDVSAGYRASFTLTTTSGSVTAPIGVAAFSVTLISDEVPVWSVEQQGFFQKHYGLETNPVQLDESLINLKTFMQQTGLDAQQVEAVLSQRTHFPRLSPNCPSTNPQFGAAGVGTPYPHASHFGACYVNGHGSGRYDSVTPATATSIRKDQFDNSMGLKEVLVGARKTWLLTKTSANRFDRLQRMIRLQRWLDLPFAELDTLIISAIRSEGEYNLTMDLNLNTLRALGVYRYLAQRYKLKPLEFAAFLHDLTPYATGNDVPLFDQVFNEVTLFDVPLVLDQQVFNATGTDVASKRTVAQLCAGLGLQPTELSFLRLAGQTQQHVGPLKRDLETVSSVYRQARVPQMFGLSAEDGWTLVDLLGGQDHQRLLCTGRLSPQSGHSIKPIYIKAVDSRINITLALVFDPLAEGDSSRLLPGSMLSVEMGSDFAHTVSALREFTLELEVPKPSVEWFLTNSDDSRLTLDPVEAGGSLSLTGKKIIRAGWEAINDSPAKPIPYLRVRCGELQRRLLSVEGITTGEALQTPPDILDLLMQMDWAVTWLKDSKQSVADVRRLLGLDPGDYLPPQGLIDRLAKLADDTRAAVITDQQIEALNLPTHEASAKGRGPEDAINWRTVLLPLLDEQGLVKACRWS
ncbi:Tc toxin subunit A [Pseudomonas sp. BIC9C]|uniref:Tc toxin subunit A n=1 Tax=Pseudomonas sp. BIC9C TaxID=3078458 RepID=UPI002AD5405C|nr:Tc toxin subunit A [Pseudomonas sp. BIC9C]